MKIGYTILLVVLVLVSGFINYKAGQRSGVRSEKQANREKIIGCMIAHPTDSQLDVCIVDSIMDGL